MSSALRLPGKPGTGLNAGVPTGAIKSRLPPVSHAHTRCLKR